MNNPCKGLKRLMRRKLRRMRRRKRKKRRRKKTLRIRMMRKKRRKSISVELNYSRPMVRKIQYYWTDSFVECCVF